jgi:hypothetical protein
METYSVLHCLNLAFDEAKRKFTHEFMKRETYDGVKYYTVQKFAEYLYHSGHDDRLAALIEVTVSADSIDPNQIRMSVTGSPEIIRILQRDLMEEEATEEIIKI